MSKYTEAIAKLRGIKGLIKTDGKDFNLINTTIDALEIADRLENVDARQIVRKVTCDICCEAETCGQGELGDWCCEYGAILKGIKLALADIRGDEE